jgi:two-component system response regulator ChvI
LTLNEFRIVDLLAGRPGRDVRYRELYDQVHGAGFIAGSGEEGYRGNVRTLIKRIRQKFRALDTSFEAIENYPGFGYRWRDDKARQ